MPLREQSAPTQEELANGTDKSYFIHPDVPSRGDVVTVTAPRCHPITLIMDARLGDTAYKGRVVDFLVAVSSEPVSDAEESQLTSKSMFEGEFPGGHERTWMPVNHKRKSFMSVAVDKSDRMNAPNATYVDDTDAIEYLRCNTVCVVTTLWEGETVDFSSVVCPVKVTAQ